MPYKIEVTADSLSELAGKVLALAAQFQAVPVIVHHSGVKPKAAKPVVVVKEAAEEAPVDPTPAPKSAPPVEATESQPTTPEASSTPAERVYDFNTDISPLVLRVAAEKGRPAIAELLSQFGVERASNVPTEQFGELLNALKDVLGE
jgi:hypothetical protein